MQPHLLQANSLLRSARESLPSVDSAVDSWGELGEVIDSSIPGLELSRLWDTTSIDSGQLDIPLPPYPWYDLKT